MVGSAERKGEGSSSMETTEDLRKWAILRVGFPPVGDNMSSSLSSKMASSGSTILGVSRSFLSFLSVRTNSEEDKILVGSIFYIYYILYINYFLFCSIHVLA